jgi:phosphate transport system permease protein
MATIDYSRPLTASGNLRRRHAVDRLMRWSATAAALIAVGVLVLFIEAIAQRGAGQMSIAFFTQNPPEGFGLAGGGIANAIIGSLLVVAVATLMALPLGLLIALYLSEYASPRTAVPIRLALDLLFGVPTVVIAIFLFGLLVSGVGQTGFDLAIALAIIMLPLIARSSGESLALVPQELRDASYALGISRWRTIVGQVIPSALGGVLTGTVLAIARAAGETAPALFLSSLANPNTTSLNIFGEPLNNIPFDIYTFSESGTPDDFARAWGAAFVLVMFVLITSLTARWAHQRSTRMMQRR